jgi:iron complex outermembrane receptor protein
LRARYEHSTGFFAQTDYTGRGRHRLRDERPVYQNPYEELGARIGYEHKHVSVFLYGNNLTDRRSASLLFALSSDGAYVESPATPRTFGVSVTFKY